MMTSDDVMEMARLASAALATAVLAGKEAAVIAARAAEGMIGGAGATSACKVRDAIERADEVPLEEQNGGDADASE